MAMTINTNISAMQVTNALNINQANLQSTMQKLSTGSRINTAADDPAGLAISQGLQAQIGGLNQASQNAANGMSLIQTASGALTQVSNLLQNLRNLAVSAANDTQSASSRQDIATEANSLIQEIARISTSTNFNGISLLDGTAGSSGNGQLTLQVGAGSDAINDQVTVDLSAASLTGTIQNLQGAQFTSTALTAGTSAQPQILTDSSGTALTVTDTAGTANTYDLAFNGSDQLVAIDATTGDTIGLVRDSDGHALTKNDFRNATSNTLDVATIDGDASALAASSTVALNTTGAGTGLDFLSSTGALSAIADIDTEIQNVSTAQANLGASQLRLQSTQQSLAIDAQNLTAANSQISDTDMASAMAEFTKNNVLVQAGTAMLSQADQQSQLVLKLLQG